MRRLLLCLAATFLVSTDASASARLVEPTLRLNPSSAGETRVALTLDACGGKTDNRILSALVDNNIPATIFVTGRWLKLNTVAFAVIRAHPELFEIENHGWRHVPTVETRTRIYGLKSAGSVAAVDSEVELGAAAITRAGGHPPHWFRGATAKYSDRSMTEIGRLGFRLAGFSINADGGSLLSANATEKRVLAAKDGDVLLAHINQPSHKAGAGLVRGLLALKARGVKFVRLQDSGEAGY